MMTDIIQYMENITPQKVFQIIALFTAPFAVILGVGALISLFKNNATTSSVKNIKDKQQQLSKKSKVHATH